MPDDLGLDNQSPEAIAENPLAAEVPALFQESTQDQPQGLGIPKHVLADVLFLGLEEPGGSIRFSAEASQPEVGAPDPMADHPWYGQAEMTQETFNQAMAGVAGQGTEPEPMAVQPEPFEASPTGFAEPEQGLEAMVAQDPLAAQSAPGAMCDPMMADPYAAQQQMYDDQMQPFMDPWMMPGPFGPGPTSPGFGPMPGP